MLVKDQPQPSESHTKGLSPGNTNVKVYLEVCIPVHRIYSALQKYSHHLNFLAHFNHKCKCILLGFYAIVQVFLQTLFGQDICFSIDLIILRDTLLWRAPLLITHPRMFI